MWPCALYKLMRYIYIWGEVCLPLGRQKCFPHTSIWNKEDFFFLFREKAFSPVIILKLSVCIYTKFGVYVSHLLDSQIQEL